jgi:acrylyl-CoA reductase (NADPH)
MFNAVLLEKEDAGQSASVTALDQSALPEADVLVRIDYSTINYKDALALTGAAPIARRYPMVPGIDFAGTIEYSDDPRWPVGTRVLLNGWGVGEGHWGGLSQYARVKGDWLLQVPPSLTTRQVMAIGTAGYTAALCVNALIDHGTASDNGPILVTGATGGVGSISVALLAAAGYQVTAATGKLEATDYLTSLGAHAVIDRSTLIESGKPLQKELWNGVIDAVGGNTLANACAQTRYSGAVAACGLAESPKLPTTVMPFILRGVTLYGIDSVMAPIACRERAWQRIADHLNTDLLDGMVQEISLAQALTEASSVIAGKVTGRLLVDVNR